MTKYRISKYAPRYRNEKGEYVKKEWTSYADIGKEFDSGKLTLKTYLEVEENYESVVEKIFCDNNISSVTVEELEQNFTLEELQSLLNPKGIWLSDVDIEFVRSLKNGNIISRDYLKEILLLILRDCCWCKLVSPEQKFIVEFGYDLYIYVTCDRVTISTIQKAESLGIYIERM